MMGSPNQARKHTTFCDKDVFHYCLATSMTNWLQIFTGMSFYAYIEIHQVRRLVVDNYKKCPVSLNIFLNLKMQNKVLYWFYYYCSFSVFSFGCQTPLATQPSFLRSYGRPASSILWRRSSAGVLSTNSRYEFTFLSHLLHGDCIL